MVHIPKEMLLLILVVLVITSAIFAASETGMMSLNRYRLRHHAKTQPTARRINEMLKRPDRLLGMLLIGNTFSNIFSSSIATMVAIDYFGESLGVTIATIGMTLGLLIFAEVAPKTLAANYPEKVASLTVYPLSVMAWILYPLVWLTNTISNGLLRLFGFQLSHHRNQALSTEELKTFLESSTHQSSNRKLIMSIFDLESFRVTDIFVPKAEIVGVDIEQEWASVLAVFKETQYTVLPIYQKNINNILGFCHVRDVVHLMLSDTFNREVLLESLEPAYFVPEYTTLYNQLLHFQRLKKHIGIVVDEYGDVQGLVTLDDILEEIVGDFTTDSADNIQHVHQQADGSYMVDGGIPLRELNETMDWTFPTTGAKTLSGLIIQHLEMIPPVGTCLLLADYPVEVVSVQDNRVTRARVSGKQIHHQPPEFFDTQE